MKRDPQIFRKCEMVLLYFTDEKWYKNIPKMWRFFNVIPEKIKKKLVCVNMQKFRVRHSNNATKKVA